MLRAPRRSSLHFVHRHQGSVVGPSPMYSRVVCQLPGHGARTAVATIACTWVQRSVRPNSLSWALMGESEGVARPRKTSSLTVSFRNPTVLSLHSLHDAGRRLRVSATVWLCDNATSPARGASAVCSTPSHPPLRLARYRAHAHPHVSIVRPFPPPSKISDYASLCEPQSLAEALVCS